MVEIGGRVVPPLEGRVGGPRGRHERQERPEQRAQDAPLFGEGLGLDSIDALELVLGLEQEFGIKVEDEEVGVKAFASVDALCDFIEQKKIS